MVGVSGAQLLQIRRWAPQTVHIAELLGKNIDLLHTIAAKMEEQHNVCTRHYDFAQQQIEGMGSISNELAAVVAGLRDSDRARSQEIMQLMAVIAGRHGK